MDIYSILNTCVLEVASLQLFPCFFVVRPKASLLSSFLYLNLLAAIKVTVEGFSKLV
jgi:hypothetical protein